MAVIFVVDDEEALRRSVEEFLTGSGHEVEGFSSAEKLLEAAEKTPPDIAICDVQLPGMSGIALVEELARIDPGIVRIVVTAHGNIRDAVRAMRAGAYDYLEKPVDLPKLVRLVERARAERRQGRELTWLRSGQGGSEILGESAAIHRVLERIATLGRLGPEGPTVLLTGETGVGKGLVARAIHRARFGDDAPWIEVNCAAIPASLIEAELFGYERSAFTDAKEAKPGLFEAAEGGSIFLDEIGELPFEVQSKLLSVTESGRVRRLGAVRDRRVQAAILAATNVDLEHAVREGRFRSDLFHRLAVYRVHLPSLRERASDIPLLAERFLRESAARYRRPLPSFSEEAARALESAAWPGNVRELRFTIERAVLAAPERAEVLEVEALRDAGLLARPAAPANASIRLEGDRVAVALPEGGVAYEAIERAVLAAALVRTGDNVVKAARLLHLSRDAMRYRMRKLGLRAESEEGDG